MKSQKQSRNFFKLATISTVFAMMPLFAQFEDMGASLEQNSDQGRYSKTFQSKNKVSVVTLGRKLDRIINHTDLVELKYLEDGVGQMFTDAHEVFIEANKNIRSIDSSSPEMQVLVAKVERYNKIIDSVEAVIIAQLKINLGQLQQSKADLEGSVALYEGKLNIANANIANIDANQAIYTTQYNEVSAQIEKITAEIDRLTGEITALTQANINNIHATNLDEYTRLQMSTQSAQTSYDEAMVRHQRANEAVQKYKDNYIAKMKEIYEESVDENSAGLFNQEEVNKSIGTNLSTDPVFVKMQEAVKELEEQAQELKKTFEENQKKFNAVAQESSSKLEKDHDAIIALNNKISELECDLEAVVCTQKEVVQSQAEATKMMERYNQSAAEMPEAVAELVKAKTEALNVINEQIKMIEKNISTVEANIYKINL